MALCEDQLVEVERERDELRKERDSLLWALTELRFQTEKAAGLPGPTWAPEPIVEKVVTPTSGNAYQWPPNQYKGVASTLRSSSSLRSSSLRPSLRQSAATSLKYTAPALEIRVTTPAGVPVEADKIRCALADGQAVILRFDGRASYAVEFKPTLCEDDQPEASGDRLLTEFSTAISGLKLTSAQEDFQKAASGYVNERQRDRYTRLMDILTAETHAAVVVFRLVKASGEYAEPAREGDVIVAWTPNIAESHRDLKERKAVAVPVVNGVYDALLHSHALAPFSLRVDASTAVDAPSEPLCYDDVYRKIFQVARVAVGSPPRLQKEISKRDRRDSKWRDQRVSWRQLPKELPEDLSATSPP